MNPATAAPASAENSNCIACMDPSLECEIKSSRRIRAQPRADYSLFSQAAQQGCISVALPARIVHGDSTDAHRGLSRRFPRQLRRAVGLAVAAASRMERENRKVRLIRRG